MAGYTTLYAIPVELYKRFKEIENREEKTITTTEEDDSNLLPIQCTSKLTDEKELNSKQEEEEVERQGEENAAIASAATSVAKAVSLETIDQDSTSDQNAACDEKPTPEADKGEEEEEENSSTLKDENMHGKIVFDPASNLTDRYEEARGSLPAIRSKTLSIKDSIMKFPDIVSLHMGESSTKCSKYKNLNKHKSLKERKRRINLKKLATTGVTQNKT